MFQVVCVCGSCSFTKRFQLSVPIRGRVPQYSQRKIIKPYVLVFIICVDIMLKFPKRCRCYEFFVKGVKLFIVYFNAFVKFLIRNCRFRNDLIRIAMWKLRDQFMFKCAFVICFSYLRNKNYFPKDVFLRLNST